MPKNIKYPSESLIYLNIPNFSGGINTKVDDNLSNFKYARAIHNFSFSDGALKNGIGFKNIISELTSNTAEQEILQRELDALGSIDKVFHFYIYNQKTKTRDDKLIIVDDEYKLYYINLYDETKTLNYIRNITFTSSPIAVRYRLNGEDVMILSSESDNMVVWNGYDLPYQVLDAPKISSMALHYERLFATVDGEKNSVWFSDDLDPTNWSLNLEEAGFIELIDERGALIKVVSFCDYIYIFREYGISRLSAYGDQTNFAISNLFVSSGKIYSDSVCVCGDKIFFLASDGLYRFDGVDTIKILDNISSNISNIKNQTASACYYNGSYYLACKFKFENDIDNCDNLYYANALIEVDINNYTLKNITHGINIKYLTAFTADKLEGVIVLANNASLNDYSLTKLDNSSKFLNENLVKTWISPKSIINNINNQKTLKKIYLESAGDCLLFINYDDKIATYSFSGSNKPIIKRVNLPFYNFSFTLKSSDSICEIKNLKFEFSSVNGRI